LSPSGDIFDLPARSDADDDLGGRSRISGSARLERGQDRECLVSRWNAVGYRKENEHPTHPEEEEVPNES
jgi:hypothetical protein